MAVTTRLELATAAVTAQRGEVLQKLTRPRGLPNTAQVVQDIVFCGLSCGSGKAEIRTPDLLVRSFQLLADSA